MDCGPDIFTDTAHIVRDGIVQGVAEAGLTKFDRIVDAMGPTPSEESCRELAIWTSNIRFYDGAAPDTLVENRLLQHYGMAFDINVRMAFCYLEADESGNPTPQAKLSATTALINRYGVIGFTKGVSAIHQNPPSCADSITPAGMNPYNLGGHAGWQYIVTVGIL